jgi:hypothetical protein
MLFLYRKTDIHNFMIQTCYREGNIISDSQQISFITVITVTTKSLYYTLYKIREL